MSGPFPEGLDLPLSTGPTGDVVAARLLARQLLNAAIGSFPDLVDQGLATLTLTAACLHTSTLLGGETRRSDLARYLTAMLEVGMPGPALLRSPMQFVRYAALELQALPTQRRVSLLQALIGVVSSGAVLEAGQVKGR